MKQIMNKGLTLVFIAVALVFGTVGFLLLNHSVAWFSENDTARAEGLSVAANITPNLIIGKSAEELTGEDAQFEVSFEEIEASNMIAVTHDDNVADTYLKYLVSHYAVDHNTGNAKDGMSLEFKPAPTDGGGVYFVDYTVYIASAYEALPVSSLEAAISAKDTVDEDHPYFNAMSVDFYVGEVSAEGYRGTTSVAGSLRGERIVILGEETIPLNTDGNIKIIMRCYFDGALQNSDTHKAYVNSNTVLTDGIAISVSFTATDAEVEE